jgi:mRNA interferase RelE/StbE
VTVADGWRIELAARAQRDIKRLDPPVRRRVVEAIRGLIADPPEGDIKRLTGSDELRLRVGDWRVRFTRDNDQRLVTILRVLPRGRAYRD